MSANKTKNFMNKEEQNMKLQALSHYDDDMDTRYGDCIMLLDDTSLIVYDCGHQRHADEVEAYLEKHLVIKDVHIVISHNDSDHINGISALMEYLYENNYTVTLYTSLYLKATKEIMDILDDNRRKENTTREHILELFNNIKDIVEKAEEYEFTVKNAEVDTKVSTGKIVGPTVDEFAAVVAEAIEKQSAGAKIDDETVMNAASVQLNIKIDDASEVLLCGDASRYIFMILINMT